MVAVAIRSHLFASCFYRRPQLEDLGQVSQGVEDLCIRFTWKNYFQCISLLYGLTIVQSPVYNPWRTSPWYEPRKRKNAKLPHIRCPVLFLFKTSSQRHLVAQIHGLRQRKTLAVRTETPLTGRRRRASLAPSVFLRMTRTIPIIS